VDARSDIFSFGAVLYELLSGRRAFGRETLTATLAAVIAQEPPPLKEAPSEVARIVGRMLAKPREARYPSAEAVLVDLQAAAAGAGLAARRRWLAGAAALVMVIAAVAGFDVRGWRTRLIDWMSAPAPSIRLAVLPFANLSGDPAEEYLSDGLTQEMIVRLGSLHPETLSVIARTSVMRYKNTDKPIEQIGGELNVDYILEGSAQREAGRVRITAELIRVRNQAQLWADSFEREMSGILALQSEVAKKVAGSLALKLLPAEQARLATGRPVNPEAYEAYLKGMQYWYRLTAGDLDSAQKYFELALTKDPNYAPAYAGIGAVWAGRQQMGYVSPSEAGPKARAAAEKAIALDDTVAASHLALAGIATYTDWDWAAAEREYKRAIELNPSFPDARAYYATLLGMILRRPREAMPQIERALELDPFNPLFRSQYAVHLFSVGQYDDAIAQARQAVESAPDHRVAECWLWLACSRKGMSKEALVWAKAYMNAYGDPAVTEAFDRGYVEGGYPAAMRLAADQLVKLSRRSYVRPTDTAHLYREAGEKAKALDWLEKGFEFRDPTLPLISLPVYDGLRSEPRFQALLHRMNLPQ
jgi:TolB-like protein/Tfp pilus assembly protein PilF